MGYSPVLEQDVLGLASFVPMKLASRVMTRPGHYQERRFEGCVLFADISGYVRITEELGGAGKRGLEQLSALLDASFVHYLDVIGAHGGEVVCFAGDGLVAYWDAEGSSAAAAARAAISCANELCHAQDGHPGHANPTLHVGVAAGDLWSARVGGFEGRWELLLGGDAVRSAARAQGLGSRKEVIATDRVLDLVPGISAERRVAGYSLVRAFASNRSDAVSAHDAHPQLALSDIRELVPTAVSELNAGDAGGWSAELRRVSALFVRIEGLDERHDLALERFQRAANALQQGVRSFSNSAGQLIIDDKGLVFLVTLGTPHNAHIDDQSRAAHAALALRDQLHGLGLRASIGFATGTAFCGVLGTGRRRAYATVGRPMNLAARMMSEAQGTVLCADADVQEPLDGLTWVALGQVRAKGLDRPVEMYRLERSTHAAHAPRLFGRKAEHVELHARLDALIAGAAGLCVVTGEAGMGKSSLMRELLTSARERGISSALGRADAAQTAPYAAFRSVFEALFGIEAGADRLHARVRVLAQLERLPQLQPLAPLLSSVLPIDLEDTAPTHFLVGQARADATLRMLVDCIDVLAQRPLVLVIEDAQWLDSASWRLVAGLSQRVPHLLLALATRPTRLDPEIDALLAARVSVLELQPLDAQDAADLIEHALGDRVHPDVSRAIYQHTKGHPLFAQEYARLLRELGRVVAAGDGFRFAAGTSALDGMSPPATVQAAITSRLDHLPESERLLVKVASVLGQEFEQDLLTAVYPRAEERTRIGNALENLCARQLLDRKHGHGRAFSFHHAIIRDVAYDLMLEHQRSALHRAVADVVEGRSRDQTPRDDALLAHHWKLAGDRDKTLHYSDLATTSALENGAYREAVALLDTCVALTELPRANPDMVRRRRQLADAHAGLGDIAAREDAARKALALAGVSNASAAPVRGLIAVATIVLNVARQRSGLQLPPSAQVGLDLELSKVHSHLAEVSYYRGDAVGLAAEQLCAIKYALQHGRSAALAGAIAQLGGSLTIAGAHALSRRALDVAIDISSEVDEPLSLAFAHMVHALCAVGRAEWDQVEISVRISQEICQTVQSPTQWCNSQMVAFWANHYRGETEASGQAARLLYERAQSNHNTQQTVWGERALAVYELERGAPEAARVHAERVVESLSGDHANEVVAAWGTCALARLRTSDLPGAQAAIERALETGAADKRQTSHGNLAGWSGIAEVALRLNEQSPRRHSALVDRALAGLAQYQRSFRVGEPSYCYFRGLAEMQRGRSLLARGFFLRGFLAAERIGARLERDRLASALGR